MHEKFMKECIKLARCGEGLVNPNPLVGAVIVYKDQIIGRGYHEKYGENHAEVNAINDAKKNIRELFYDEKKVLENSTLYVNLEPCSHYGKTPPCTKYIIENGIRKVIIGILDPNPLVKGNGVKELIESGVDVQIGILKDECTKINEVFIKFIKEKTPFVILKAGISLDSKIATSKGESKWITSEKSRKEGQKLRNKLSGIMVGVNTVIKDDPSLTCRLENGRNPVRIIVDSKLRTPVESNVIRDNMAKTIIATTKYCDREKKKHFKTLGIKILEIECKKGQKRVNLKNLMEELYKLNIDSILLEGGGELNFEALKEGIVDKINLYIAPIIIGGKDSKTFVEGCGIQKLKEAIKLKDIKFNSIDEDIFIEAYL